MVTIVGDVVDVNEVVSIVVKDENVLIRLLRLLEKVILPSEKYDIFSKGELFQNIFKQL